MRSMWAVFGVAVLQVAGPAAAQQVELMTFDGRSDAIVLNVGATGIGEPESIPDADLKATLEADFEGLGIPPTQDWTAEPVVRSSIVVPMWMQTGRPDSTNAVWSSALYQPTVGCSAPLYVPRHDLGFATEQRRAAIFPLIAAIACEQGLSVGLFDALIAQESRYRLDAMSPAGAMGLAQLMPGTARYLGVVDPWDAIQNLRGGARYLREQLDEFGRVDLALAAYNAGPGRVRPRRVVPRIRETVNYVATITTAWSQSVSRESALLLVDTPQIPRNPFPRAAVLTYTSPSTSKPM